MHAHIFLLLALCGGSLALVCHQVKGNLKQIDAGNGQVIGVDENGIIFTRFEGQWLNIPGKLAHVTVGPAGIWGVDDDHAIYRMQGGSWALLDGLLKQIDAGGNGFVSGANMVDDIFCVQRDAAISAAAYDSPVYNHLDGKLKYYSCGPQGCWGVNSVNDIFFRTEVTPNGCLGKSWVQIDGKLSMIEVGTDGSVYGVNHDGKLFRRDGISPSSLTGTQWTYLRMNGQTLKHVTTDQGQLWLLTQDNRILHCK
ncbi:fish-egg lectin-like [Scyliorhinus canicula]|uniref:fish-egg lectin-like n=1 Tax=Scyliorhinus canicula TaxID=7830 RepID=UPI0018F47103|nr:fish-egg lectin-like [Scyliorhinus canicula]